MRRKICFPIMTAFTCRCGGLIEKLRQNAMGYTIKYQNTIRAFKAGLKIVEFPTYEGQRVAGGTKAHSFHAGVVFLKCLAKEILLGNKIAQSLY